jgi:hypothetical protein
MLNYKIWMKKSDIIYINYHKSDSSSKKFKMSNFLLYSWMVSFMNMLFDTFSLHSNIL